MADWWVAVDALGFAAAGHLLRDLGELPDTDATLARFFDELRKGLPAKVWFPLCQRLTALPFATLERHIGDVRDASHLLTPGDVRHAEDRLALANLPPDVLWKKLLAHAVECDGKHAGGQDSLLVFRLTEALARHPEFAAPRALKILHDESIEDWREIFASELAGALRCRDAIGLLIAKLRIDTDYMIEQARAALVRIGDSSIPALIASTWEKEEWHFRNYAHGAIASFRTRENTDILRGLVALEEDESLQIFMAVSLLEMLPDDAETLGFVRKLVLPFAGNTPVEDVDLLIATVATMAEWDFPERAEWRTRAIAEEKRFRIFLDREEKPDEAIRTGMITGLTFREASKLAFGPDYRDPDEWEDSDAPVLPFIRESPKVGRNDPCLCNSGKKFKKCCGKAA